MLLVWEVSFPTGASAYLLKDEKRGTSLSIFGLGMSRLNYAAVEGDIAGFENSDDGYAQDFDTREFLSLAANGILFRDYALEGEVKYNHEDDPDWNFWLKLSRDEHYLFLGDQPDILTDTYFTRYTSPFRGATLHLETEKFTLTSFGAVTRGSLEQEEILPDGTSGPYLLDNIPVVPGSESVTLEIRKRNDQDVVAEVIPQDRNVDYTIDYDTGEITFAEPVETETFGGDPIVILVTYRSEEESSAFNTALGGSRVAVTPVEWLEVGASYISEFDRNPTLSDGFDARREIYGLDTTVTLGDGLNVRAEYALSQHQQDALTNGNGANAQTDDEPVQALQVIADGTLGEKVTMYGKYQVAEREFLTFANPDIDTDEQTLDLIGKYAFLPNQTVELGYSFSQDNLPQDPETPTTTTHRPYIGWDATFGEQTELYSKYEYIQTTDDFSPQETDKQTHVALAGIIRDFQRVPLLDKLSLRSEYQFSDFEDKTDQEADTLTHQLAVQARTEPVKDISLYVEQKERLIHDKDLDEDTERQDISEVGIDLEKWVRFSLNSSYQYRVEHDLLHDQRNSERHTFILRSEYKPFEIVTTTGKLELRDETFFAAAGSEDEADRSTQTLNLEGRILVTPRKDLTARLRYSYEYTQDEGDVDTTTREDETEFRLNYAFDQRKTRLTGIIQIERDLLEAPPTPETETRTITYAASAARQLTDRWDVLAQYKRELVDLQADNYREDALGEIGCKLGRFIKLVGGCQYSNFEDNVNGDSNYEAYSYFLKIIGKL